MTPANGQTATQLGLLTPEEAAQLLGVKVSWLRQHSRRQARDRIPFVKMGHYIRYRLEDLLAYIQRCRVDVETTYERE